MSAFITTQDGIINELAAGIQAVQESIVGSENMKLKGVIKGDIRMIKLGVAEQWQDDK